MKTIKTLAMVAVIALIATGCASISTAKKFNGEKLSTSQAQDVVHINGQNWGLYLLWIPILTGSTDNVGDMTFGKDTVNLEKVVDMTTAKAKEEGCTKFVDMGSSVGSAYIFPVFFLKSVQVSGNGLK